MVSFIYGLSVDYLINSRNNSEASDKYIKAINRMNIVTFLSSFLLSGDQCPTRVIIAAGEWN